MPSRGASATKKDPASCPPHPAKSRREWLLECRREQPPMPRPTTPPAGKSTRRPPRGATFGASANSTHLARHTRYTATGSALCRVERSLSPSARHTRKRASGSGYSDAICTEGQQTRCALFTPCPPPHDSAQQDKLPPCCPPRGAMSSATPQETTCPAPPTPRKETRGVGARMPFCSEKQQHVSGGLSPFTWTNSRQGERVTIHTRNRPG